VIARKDKDDGLTGRQMRVMRRQTRLEGRIRIEPGFQQEIRVLVAAGGRAGLDIADSAIRWARWQ
jgi:hypothetical protein